MEDFLMADLIIYHTALGSVSEIRIRIMTTIIHEFRPKVYTFLTN